MKRSQTVNVGAAPKPDTNNKRQVTDIQHSARLHKHQIRHRSIQRNTSTDKTGEKGSKSGGGVGSCPGARSSTFFVGNRPVNVCKKLALSVCEDMRLPQRSMAYGWDEWNGDNKVSVGATGGWGCTYTPAHTTCVYTMTHKYTPNMSIGTGTYILTDEDTSGRRTNQCNAINTI